MPPFIASFVYLSLVAYLFYRDMRQKPNVTSALWLPWSWLTISGTRFISEWLSLLGFSAGGTSLEEGSPVDAVYFFLAIVVGAKILQARRVRVNEFIRHNRWVAIYLVFCLLGCLWSDFPLVGFKRWTKLIGSPIMVLIVLTEPDPREAIVRLFKRVAYIIVPISFLFIKYYPELGRGFEAWTGEATNGGITTNKNTLGVDCLILGCIFFWHILMVWQQPPSRERKNELLFSSGFLFFIFSLLHVAKSSTSLLCLVVAIAVMLGMGFSFVVKERMHAYVLGSIVIFLVAQLGFHISDYVIQALGKNTTLTGRTEIWDVLMKWDINPIMGTGFESFWLGERREQLWTLYPVLHLNSAHNGYIETYLNLGIAGLLVTLGMLLATYHKAYRDLVAGDMFGRVRLSYLLVFLIYNMTEVGFRTHTPQFFLFFLAAISYPNARWQSALSPHQAGKNDFEF